MKKKKFIIIALFAVALFSISAVTYAQFASPQPFHKSGANWLMNSASEQLGSSASRIAKIWATDIDSTTLSVSGATTGNFGVGTTTPGSVIEDVFSTGTSSLRMDSNNATSGACIILKDNDGGGYTYLSAINGTLITSTTACN